MKKRQNLRIVLAAFASLAIITGSSFTNPSSQSFSGDALYRKNCRQCHGDDGTKGLFGAKNLKLSGLETSAIIQQIKKGKGIMPSFGKKFNEEELNVLADYVKSLRKPWDPGFMSFRELFIFIPSPFPVFHEHCCIGRLYA